MDKKKTQIEEDFNFFWSKNKFSQSPKSTKKYSFKYNGYKPVIDIVQNFGMSETRILIYTLDIYNLQTRIVSFPDQEKLLKKVDSC